MPYPVYYLNEGCYVFFPMTAFFTVTTIVQYKRAFTTWIGESFFPRKKKYYYTLKLQFLNLIADLYVS